MRAIIWAAVSSKPQLEGDSLEAQIRDAQEACQRFGWEIVAILKVPGQSRDYIFFQDARELTAYREFEALCQDSRADVLVCRGRDRLGRTDALIAQVEALAVRAGMQIYSLAMPSAIVEPEQAGQDRGIVYAAAIERASAQVEMIELRRRHQMGMRARIRKGLHPSTPPYGYRYNGDDPVAIQVQAECAIVRQIAEFYLAGWGMKRIATHLNSQSVSSPGRNGQWSYSTIRRLLRTSFYAGWAYYGQTISPGKHEPIFSPEEWTSIQAEHKRRKITRGKAAYPYSGLVRCKVCGYSMIATTFRRASRTYCYYRCWEGQTRDAEGQQHHTMVRVEAVREAVLTKVAELHNPEVLEAVSKDRAFQERQALEKQKLELGDVLGQLSREMALLLEAHARWETMAVAEFDQAITEAMKRKKALEDSLLAVNLALQELPDPEIRAQQLRELVSNCEAILDSPDVEEANAWLSKRVKAVWCQANQVIEVELI